MKYKVGQEVILIQGDKCLISGIEVWRANSISNRKEIEYVAILSTYFKGETVKDKSGFINTEIEFTHNMIDHEKTLALKKG